MEFSGQVVRRDLGPGAWALVTDTGETYELNPVPPDLKQEGLRVQGVGEIREGVMTLAMIGPVLAVASFTILADDG